jgi:hypothetical protein
MSALDSYPLDAEWLADERIAPRLIGFQDFEEGVTWAAEQLRSLGFVMLRYGCLSAFDVTISNYEHVPGGRPSGVPDDPDFFQVSIGCGSYGGSYPQPCRVADPHYVGEKLNLLRDDARAVAYLLRRIGQAEAAIRA